MSKSKTLISIFTTACAGLFTAVIIFAWTEPSSAPPADNVPIPINTGDTAQSKTGDLRIGGKMAVGTTTAPSYVLDVNGDVNISENGSYKINGIDVLWSTSTGESIFIGEDSGPSNTGWANTFLGYQAGYSNTTGEMNTFIGRHAGNLNTTGGFNTFVGYNAGEENTTGHSNTFVGHVAGGSNQTGNYNTFVGRNAGEYNVHNDKNTCVGYRAGYAIGGDGNIYLGHRTGGSIGPNPNDGYENVFIGNYSGGYNSTGSSNVFIGYGSGWYNTTGSYNTFLGKYAGFNNEIGSNNVFIGYKAGYYATSSSDKLYIANGPNDSDVLIYGDFSSGKVGIGTTNPEEKLEVNGGIRLNTTTGKPACDASTRGTLWFTRGGAGVKDSLEICAKDASDVYAWRIIY